MPEKREEKTAVPRLRFPEFRDAGPWEVKRLGNLVKTVTPPAKLQTSEYLPSGQFPIIDQSPSDICGWTNDETAVVQGDFPFVIFGDHTCTVKLATGPFAQGADGIKILAPSPKIEARFLFLVLQANQIEQKSYKRHFSTLKEKLIPFPQKDTGEQQKIADCLSSLDDLIRAEEERLEALKQHKKGLMQHIFPREGETTPRLRFPEFRDAGPWEVKRLGDVCVIRTGKKDANEGQENGIYPFYTCAENHIYSNTYSFDCEAILIAGNANVGQTKYYKGKFEAYQRTYVLSNFSGINTQYLYSYLSGNLQNDLALQVQTSAMSYIKLSMLKTYRVPAPRNPSEQQKIADCLSSLDDLIRAQGEKIEALKQHKKGLMQQLFPQEVG